MSTRYGIAELFALVGRLLAPFVDPLRAEFATRPAQPQPAAEPTPEPTPVEAPAPVFDVSPVALPLTVAELFPTDPAEVLAAASEVLVVTTARDRITAERVTTAAEETFYVRLPGKQVRYRQARDDDRGQRYTLGQTPKGRKKYTPVSVTKFGAKAK